jgi:hypothetical protein
MASTEGGAAAGWQAPPAVTSAYARCPNCGGHTSGHFCASCGQETRIALPTFRDFMREAAGRYVALDGRTWRTLFALVARPGFLTLEYLGGRRRKYIRPARLFLVLYLVLFALIGLLQSPADIAEQVVFVDSKTVDGTTASRERLGARDEAAAKQIPGDAATKIANANDKSLIQFDDEDLDLTLTLRNANIPVPDVLRNRYEHFKQLPPGEKARRLYAGMLRYGTYAILMLLPAFALLLKLTYLGRGDRYPGRPQRYAEHLVYSAHMHAFAALMLLTLLVLPLPPVQWGVAIWSVIYAMRARQRVYRGRWWGGLLRGLVVGVAYMLLVAFAMLGLVAVSALLQ